MRHLALLLGLLALVAGCAAPAVPIPTFDDAPPPGTIAGPTRVEVPAIDARGELVPLGLNDDGTLAVPPVEEPQVPSWFDRGPRPGEPGPAVIAGHVNGGGQPGIFARLHELERGELVHVDRADGSRVTFEVTRVERVAKDAFPTEAVYGDTPGPELRLITCGGVFDRAAASYTDNWVVFATIVE
ncbi:class F sortase [Pseudonocardia parietis]|uniref:Sortase (Surface protein transpeptidase) n=1 Tax=Pseudonocardia parietis TaxID=570936 RepID=A0ABS4W203_9PSEU|nr:class F sortase [Pseudonocardia parietis]MBP2370204.1 sortase (surface protein transpeptidase) [Pseudonocardia parietis]